MMKWLFATVLLACAAVTLAHHTIISTYTKAWTPPATANGRYVLPPWVWKHHHSVCRLSTIVRDPWPSCRSNIYSYNRHARYCWIFAGFRGVRHLSISIDYAQGLPVWVADFAARITYQSYVWMDLNEVLVYTLHHSTRYERITVLNDVGIVINVIKTMNERVARALGNQVTALGKLLININDKLQRECPDGVWESCAATKHIEQNVQQTLKPINEALQEVMTHLLQLTGDVVTPGRGPSVIQEFITKIKAAAAQLDNGKGSGSGGLLGVVGDLLNSLLNILPGVFGGGGSGPGTNSGLGTNIGSGSNNNGIGNNNSGINIGSGTTTMPTTTKPTTTAASGSGGGLLGGLLGGLG